MLPWMSGDCIMTHAEEYILTCVERIHLHMNDKPRRRTSKSGPALRLFNIISKINSGAGFNKYD